MINIEKIISTPQNEYEVVRMLVKTEQHLIDALWILEAIIEDDGNEFLEYRKKKIKQFLKQFQ